MDSNNHQDTFVLIMAGGVGSRFWPASREERPKQFLDIMGVGKSLLRLTFERCNKIAPADHIFVITNKKYATQVAQHLPELDEDQIFNEPSRNNTAPCIAFASLKLKKKFDTGVCLVAPSDAMIEDEEAFVSLARKAIQYAGVNDALVTLGITPTRPDTGYGYIQFDKGASTQDIFPVVRFTEKPDLTKAEKFVESGDYLWNSGMFVWSLDTILNSFRKHASTTLDILESGTSTFYTGDEEHFLAEHYPLTEKLSVDYAIMERAANVFVIPADFGWSDLGTWGSLHQKLDKDENGNAAVNGPVVLHDTQNTLVHTKEGKLVVAAGVKDLMIICEDDVILIFPKHQEQEVKKVRSDLDSRDLKDYL